MTMMTEDEVQTIGRALMTANKRLLAAEAALRAAQALAVSGPMPPVQSDRELGKVRDLITAWHATLPDDDPARTDERWRMSWAERAGIAVDKTGDER